MEATQLPEMLEAMMSVGRELKRSADIRRFTLRLH